MSWNFRYEVENGKNREFRGRLLGVSETENEI